MCQFFIFHVWWKVENDVHKLHFHFVFRVKTNDKYMDTSNSSSCGAYEALHVEERMRPVEILCH